MQPFAHAPFVIVTLAMLWMSKSSFIPIGIAICAFANRTGVGRRDCPVTMRQADIGGDKPFVDYAGDMLIEIDPTTDAADRDGIARHPAQVYHASG